MSSTNRKASEVIRVSEFEKAVFDLYAADLKVKTGNANLTQGEVMAALVKEALPEYVARVKDMRPDLVDEEEDES